MIGFGAGREKLRARVVLKNGNGKMLYDKKLQSTTTMGVFGSKSEETPRKLAQKIVKEVIAYGE